MTPGGPAPDTAHAHPDRRAPSDESRALVLGGGGVTGIAWLTGLVLGLTERGLDLGSVDRFIGTSAGATVAAQLTSGLSPAELFERQVDPEKQVTEIQPDLSAFLEMIPLLAGERDPVERRRRAGELALEARTVDPDARRAVIAARLPSREWPEATLVIVAVDALTGEARAFDRHAGADLVDVVAASCAVPGVWPAVRIQGRAYIDGGTASPENAGYAAGFASVLVLAPLGRRESGLTDGLEREVRLLEEGGSRVSVLTPDEEARSAMGGNALDPAKREAAARAGLRQGRSVVGAGWGDG